MRFATMLAASFYAGAITTAFAASCPGVKQTAQINDPTIESVLSAQMHFVHVSIIHSFAAGDWHIYMGSSPSEGETGFVFFKGTPKPFPQAFIWGGTAQPDEVDDVRSDVELENPGIPKRLATCFAKTVSGAK